jgi:AcrR family transcriptional regulator
VTLSPDEDLAERPGLRDRKKALRRDEIIAAARDLFARKGIDATTMAEIAEAAGISPPTVFNYFGSKDGVLIAMIDEGTRKARESDRLVPRPIEADLATLVLELFSRISRRTLEIAGKRVWRYAEAAVIRHPQTDLTRTYRAVNDDLLEGISGFFAEFDLVTRSGAACPPSYLGRLFYDAWMPLFIELITSDDMSLQDHDQRMGARLRPLIDLIFDDACAAHPRRRAE